MSKELDDAAWLVLGDICHYSEAIIKAVEEVYPTHKGIHAIREALERGRRLISRREPTGDKGQQ